MTELIDAKRVIYENGENAENTAKIMAATLAALEERVKALESTEG